ncbi:hypothetical protein C922_03353 [Plasmodium inui San Antonio 1]|uniref:Uncharacterized protein n=1 Tax=Plasmodium inui San Antonio 1 TaxID=1237626 RepID=W7A4E4_9APIC|nr:hypothetical protein C922_03353 [Plasmodium inui San Antonio 1]EUD66158.1 hypothetical protein C922_03353 [Plasmodium inui San Antonio 1]
MKVRKRSPLCKRYPQTDNDEDHDRRLLDEYYRAIPGLELQIEKLLQSFHVSKYDYKITHLLIDIIQNETIKILRHAKNIKKNGIDRRLLIKADPTRREDKKEDHISPDLVRSFNDGDGTKKDDASKGMTEGHQRTDQSKETTDIPKDACGADSKGGVIDDRTAQAVSPAMAATPANERDGEVDKHNPRNDIQEGDSAGIHLGIGTQHSADDPVTQTEEQSQDKDRLAELRCGVEDGTKEEAAGGDKEQIQANFENGEQKKQVDVEEGQQKVEADTVQMGQTEQMGQTGQTGGTRQTGQTEQIDQTGQTAEDFTIFRTFSNYFSKKVKPNEEEGEAPLSKEETNAPDKSGNDESKNRDAIEGAPKLNSSEDKAVGEGTEQVHPEVNSPPNEIQNNVNPSDDPVDTGSHFLNDEKNNVKEETDDTTKGRKVPHGMSSSGQIWDAGDDVGMAPNRDQMEEGGKVSSQVGGDLSAEKPSNQVGMGVSEEKAPTEEPQNGGENDGAKDQAEQPKNQPTNTTTEQEEVLVIDEESINLAIKEYVLKYIYKKKNVDFLYDELATQQKESNSAGIVDRKIRYPTGFPPYLPDDCSINTILPAWDIKYNFNSSKGENYQ